jgi:hypothetical protein
MDAHVAEIATKARFEERTAGEIQVLAGRAEYVSNRVQ